MASPTRFPAGVSTQAIGSTLGQFPFPDPTDICLDRKSTRLNSSHSQQSRMPSSA